MLLLLLLEELRVELNGLFIAALFQLQLMKCRVVNTNTQAGTTQPIRSVPPRRLAQYRPLAIRVYFQTFSTNCRRPRDVLGKAEQRLLLGKCKQTN